VAHLTTENILKKGNEKLRRVVSPLLPTCDLGNALRWAIARLQTRALRIRI
jgi:hypothetical protein